VALFLRIAAAVVVLATIVNAVGFVRSLAPLHGPTGGSTMFVVMGMGALMIQAVLPLGMAAIMVGLASLIDRLDALQGRSNQDD